MEGDRRGRCERALGEDEIQYKHGDPGKRGSWYLVEGRDTPNTCLHRPCLSWSAMASTNEEVLLDMRKKSASFGGALSVRSRAA